MIGRFVCICKKEKWTLGGTDCSYGVIMAMDFVNKSAFVGFNDGHSFWYPFNQVKDVCSSEIGWLDEYFK